jgi:hypothetical protein
MIIIFFAVYNAKQFWSFDDNVKSSVITEKDNTTKFDPLFILEKINVSESAYRELTVFCDGLPRKYLVSSMPGRH